MFDRVQHNNLIAETISAILVSKNITEAAELLQVDRTTLYKRFESHPEIKKIATAIQEYSQDALKLASAKATNVLVQCMDHPFPTIRMNAAKEILDRIGLNKHNVKISNGKESKNNE